MKFAEIPQKPAFQGILQVVVAAVLYRKRNVTKHRIPYRTPTYECTRLISRSQPKAC